MVRYLKYGESLSKVTELLYIIILKAFDDVYGDRAFSIAVKASLAFEMIS